MSNSNRRALHSRLYECLGKLVAARRKRLGMSQEELAEKSEVDRSFISKVERGQRSPSFALVSDLARGLQMSYGRLVQNCERCVKQDRSA
jgi:transcriptional regulator with XRE-family HTH domain